MTTTPNADALSALLSETLREETAVSDERVKELREWCQPRLNVTEGVKQPKDSWQTLTAICDELLALRAQMRWVSDAELDAIESGAESLLHEALIDHKPKRAEFTRGQAATLQALAARLSQSPPPPTQVSTPSSEGVMNEDEKIEVGDLEERDGLLGNAAGVLIDYIWRLEAANDLTRLYAGRAVVRDICNRLGIPNPLEPKP